MQGEGVNETSQRTLYHSTNDVGLSGILASGMLRPSLRAMNPKDVRHGEGQYPSDIIPGSKSPGQLAYTFLNDPRGWRRFTHFIEIDVTGLRVENARTGVIVVPNTEPLDLTGRIVDHGTLPIVESRIARDLPENSE